MSNVKTIVLTVSANDLDFANDVIDCTVAWSTSSAGLRKAVGETRAVMTSGCAE